jgi:hypothetical protein
MDSRRGGAALVVAVVGLALVVLESVQSLRSETLGTLGAILLYAGLGLFVIAGAVLITDQGSTRPAVLTTDNASDSDGR